MQARHVKIYFQTTSSLVSSLSLYIEKQNLHYILISQLEWQMIMYKEYK